MRLFYCPVSSPIGDDTLSPLLVNTDKELKSNFREEQWQAKGFGRLNLTHFFYFIS
jgi:hypothetical protein